MDNYILRINNTIDNFGTIILRNSNIVGVGRGRKVVNGEMLKEPTITFFVRRKVSSNLLHPSMIIPKLFRGSYTDVIEYGDENEFMANDIKPAKGSGVLIRKNEQDNKFSFATLSYAVTDSTPNPVTGRKNIYLLGSAHFMDPNNKNYPGAEIYYTNTMANVEKRFLLGTFYKSIQKVDVKIEDEKNYNLVDAALAIVGFDDLDSRKRIAPGFINGTKISEVTMVQEGAEVYKLGISTALTSGKVITVNTKQKIRGRFYKEQIVADISGDYGDSGSLGITKNGERVFGMLQGGSDKYATFNNITNVLKALDIKFLI